MTGVTLKASGYTWHCPECHGENYTGAAPSAVCCSECNGTFGVRSLQHRRRKDRRPWSERGLPADIAKREGGNSRSGQRTLFDAFQDAQDHQSDEDNPL